MNQEYSLAVTDQDIFKAVSILAQAFSKDPLVTYVSDHKDFPLFMFTVISKFYRSRGHIWLSNSGDSAAMCLPEGVSFELDLNLKDVKELVLRFGFKAALRSLRLDKLMSKVHDQMITDPHYYLFAIGVTDNLRSTGEGAKLCRFLFRYIQDNDLVFYAENSNIENNTEFFTHLGWDHKEPVTIDSNGTAFKPMFKYPENN